MHAVHPFPCLSPVLLCLWPFLLILCCARPSLPRGRAERSNVTESKRTLLAARRASKSGDEVLRLGIRLYLESQQTQKIAD